MIDSIGSGRVGGIAFGAIDGASAGPAEQAAAAMTTLSSRIAGTITRELGLVDRHGRQGGGKAGDIYGVDALAEELSAALGATPADAGRLSRALHEFASEAASLLASRPRASVLGMVRDLAFNLHDSDGRPGSTDADYALTAIQAAVFRLREDAPWAPIP